MPEQNENNNVELDNKTADTTQNTENKTSAEDTTAVKDDKKSKDGFFKSTIDYIKNTMKSNDIKDANDSDTTKTDAGDTDLTGVDIPNNFTSAAESLGWTGDDITEFASMGNNGKAFTDKELLEMVPEMLSQLEDSEQDKTGNKDTKQEIKSGVKSEASDKDIELRTQLKKEIIADLGLGNVEELKESIRQAKEDQTHQQQATVMNRANELFDEASKTYEVFGLTKELPKYPVGANKGKFILSSPAFKARNEVYTDAAAFMSHQGLDINESMSKALATYKGKHLEENVRHKTIKDFKAHEKSLSGSRMAKEVKKDYSSERERHIDNIRQLQRAQGQDV